MDKNVFKVIDKIKKNGFSAYMVGGCVRDILLGKIPDDYDITTSAKPYEIQKIFPKTIPTGIKHGTVTVLYYNKKYEVTTFRSDGEYINNRKPQSVVFTDNLKEDIKRRDFTINAIAFDKDSGYIDYFGGQDDIKNKLVKAVLNPYERFTEDALRILRGIRFSSALSFKIEENTFLAMKEKSHLLLNIAGERIFDELNKMFSINPYKSVKLLYEIGFFSKFNLKIKDKNIDYLANLNIKNFPLTIAEIFDLESAFIFLNHLKCSNEVKKNTFNLIKSTSYSIDCKEELKIMLSDLNCENVFKEILELRSSQGVDCCKVKKLYRQIVENNECYSLKTLDINGNDLINLGYKGNEIKTILNKALKMVIKYPSLNKKEIIKEKLQF